MRKGFTLVELLVGTVILTVISAAVMVVLYVADLTWQSDMGLLDLQQFSRQAIYGMVNEIRQAPRTLVNITVSQDQVYFQVPTDITVEPVTYSSMITYYLDGNRQIVRENPVGTGTVQIIAQDVEAISFSCTGPSISGPTDCANARGIEVQVNTNKTIRERNLVFNLTEEGSFRNKIQ